MLDGTPTLRLNEFMLAGVDKGKIPLELSEGENARGATEKPQEIVFELDHHMKGVISKAEKDFGEEMHLQDLKVGSLSSARDRAHRRWLISLVTVKKPSRRTKPLPTLGFK